MKKKKIVHIIVGLNLGGAETMLFKLLKYINKERYELQVISLTDGGVLGEKIEKLNIPVFKLNMQRGLPSIKAFLKAKALTKDADLIQSWMYHADFLGFLLKTQTFKQKLIWGIRRADLNKVSNKKSLLALAKINAFLSKGKTVDKIISCSATATETHSQFGYAKDKIITIPNGFELDNFYKNLEGKEYIFKEFPVLFNQKIVTSIGRWNIQKDYPNLIKSIKRIQDQNSNVIFLLCGTNIDEKNKELIDLLNKHEIKENVHLLGRRDDIPNILSASDLFISSSLGEGFANVIGEAMACETPCVVTDVGDSAYIVGKTGLVVPPQNDQKLAEAVLKILEISSEERAILGKLARERVKAKFDIKEVVKQFETVYESI